MMQISANEVSSIIGDPDFTHEFLDIDTCFEYYAEINNELGMDEQFTIAQLEAAANDLCIRVSMELSVI